MTNGKFSGWGRYPRASGALVSPAAPDRVHPALEAAGDGDIIARGMGRSYGDSALAATMLDSHLLDHYIHFDPDTGVLDCEAGVSLDQILRLLVPQGWFPPVTPGTRFVTVGGAIAADVHGKNHHRDGCFSAHVLTLELVLADGSSVCCSPRHNSDLFRATCGGMGLTGMITRATLQMRRIPSSLLRETVIRTIDLAQTLALFDEHHDAGYSVAWLDCMAPTGRLGRSLIMLGEHDDTTEVLDLHRVPRLRVPLDAPAGLLNRYTLRLFNALYYARGPGQPTTRRVHYGSYFYPLDAIRDWNRLYGRRGFVQYQFVLPREAGMAGMTLVLKRIARSGHGSFLSVLKALGPANDNHLSFPMEGYTLALDFRVEPTLFALLDELDAVVHDHGGRIYLAKDARVRGEYVHRGYPHLDVFREVRMRYGAHRRFHSRQSRRLGI